MSGTAGAPMAERTLLEVRGLTVEFATEDGIVRAVDDVSFHIERGETLVVVGESGSGKSVTSLAVMGLVANPPGRIASGTILMRGRDGAVRDLARLGNAALRQIRGNEIAMIFQEPMTSLNPIYTIGDQIIEAIRLHQGKSGRAAFARGVEMLELLGIPEPARRMRSYPHQMSGGMRQRAMIAMALSCHPALLIADEPTTALDVTIQAQILDLMLELKEKTGTAIVLITHDLGVVAETTQRVVVMYAGRKVEEASVEVLFEEPLHPYTRGLMRAIPRLDIEADAAGTRPRLQEIPGLVPILTRPIIGCAFAPRCGFATDRCRTEPPPIIDAGAGHTVACWEVERVRASAP
jgi:peptide/nickel transport system ATP-binding protein